MKSRHLKHLTQFSLIVFAIPFSLGCNPLAETSTVDDNFSEGATEDGSITGPPDDPTGVSFASAWTNGASPSSPVLNWTNPSSDFDHAEVALGTSEGGVDLVAFTTASSANSHTFTGLTLTECSATYYGSVKSVDPDNEESNVVSESTGFRYDNTAPTAVTTVTVTATAASATAAATADWSASAGSDNCGIDHYEIAIGYDDDADGFDSGDIGNVLSWTDVPGGSGVTSYQVQDGVDSFSFSGTFDRRYTTSIRVVDAAGNTSSATSSTDWATFDPSHITGLTLWLDGSDLSTTFTDTGCTTAATTAGNSVQCWQDKSGSGFHVTGATPPIVGSNSGIYFDGTGDILTNNAVGLTAASDITYIMSTEVDTQSTDAGSCCRPIVSWVTTSGALFPWVGLTRGDYTPANAIMHGWNGGPVNAFNTNAGERYVLASTHDGTNDLWNVYRNGTQGATNNTLPSSYTTTDFGVGGDPNNTARRYAGEIFEIVMYSSILSDSDRIELEGYLACRGDYRDDLDAGHTYYNATGTSDTGCPQ